ncbi:DUF1772 domain-containing protein [Mesorhizobium sp.]|uniref:DUF1772 domain-containing protein n=1 Tax=Mesorhizobium sp. TaxID=1871066 RepID=UPI0025E183E6|nr:DUF1772 domain-containing protein [Mesorhizobium sp.]
MDDNHRAERWFPALRWAQSASGVEKWSGGSTFVAFIVSASTLSTPYRHRSGNSSMRAFMIVTLLLVAITMALSLAHALELPGKLRLKEAAYKSVQTIYYPGFTIGGFAEIGGIVALAILLYLTPYPGARFWWTLAALVFLVAEHAVYWLVTHPVNNFWVQDVAVSKPAATFFSMLRRKRSGDWTDLRDIWEASHIARAGLAMLSLISIAVAATFFAGE